LDKPWVDSYGRWGYAVQSGDSTGSVGRAWFGNFYQGVPSEVRLAVYLPSRQKLFVTEPAKTHPFLRTYRADLHADGTGTLQLNERGHAVADAFVGLERMGFVGAVLLTLVLEGIVVAVMSRRHPRPGRMLLVCLVANLITLPVLWVVTVLGFWTYDFYWGGLLIFLAAEAAAALVESLAYVWPGRSPWRPALRIGLLANALSMCAGLAGGAIVELFSRSVR
jgi:hypothetical protein